MRVRRRHEGHPDWAPGGLLRSGRSIAVRSTLVAIAMVSGCDEVAAPRDEDVGPAALVELAAAPRFATYGDTLRVAVARTAMPEAGWLRWRVDGVVTSGGMELKIVAPARIDTVDVVVEIGVERTLAADTVRIPVGNRFAILKVDDFGLGGELSPGWIWFLDYIADEQVCAALGLVARSLIAGNPVLVRAARDLTRSRHIEFWNHGYDHVLGAVDLAGHTYSEFRGPDVATQLAHLQAAQQLALDSLGIVMHAFGAPGNQVDDNTVLALADVPEIDVWFFGRPMAGRLVLPRTVEAEESPGRVSFARFKTMYDAEATVTTLQLHPDGWSAASRAEFALIVDFLRARGILFVTPGDYARHAGF